MHGVYVFKSLIKSKYILLFNYFQNACKILLKLPFAKIKYMREDEITGPKL